MASAWPRSSAPMPGYAPGVSMKQMMGRPNLRAEFHYPQRLAIALRIGHAEIAEQFLLGVAALLVSDDDDGAIFELRKACDHGGVIRKAAVAMQLQKICAEHLDVIEGIRPLWMAGQ